MIETKVPMDVRSYKAKLIGPFTTRQLICVTIAVALDAFLFLTVINPLNIPVRLAVFILVFLDVPIVAFIAEPMGLPMEKYIKKVLIRSLIAPTKRKAKTSITAIHSAKYTAKEVKASKRKMKKLLKTHPEYKAYK